MLSSHPSRPHRSDRARRAFSMLAAVVTAAGLVAVPATAASADEPVASAVLSDPPVWEGMTGNPGDGTPEPASVATVRDGRGCWATTTTPVRNDFLYFGVDDARTPAPGGFAFVRVDYFDGGGGNVTLQYDGPDGTESAEIVPLTGTNTWKSYTFQLAAVEFGNGLPTGADFRIAAWDTRFGRSATDVCVSNVAVAFSAEEAVTLAPSSLVFSGSEPRVIPFTSGVENVDWVARDEQGRVAGSGVARTRSGVVDLGDLPLGYYSVEVTAVVRQLAITRTAPVALLAELPADASADDSPFGVNIHLSKGDPTAIFDPIAEVGFSRVRDSIRWEYVETTKGSYSLPGFGASLVENLRERDIDLSLTLALTNKFYDGNKTPSTPEGLAGFARYASELLSLTGTDTVEVYNEFDGGFNNGACGKTADCYYQMLQAVADAVVADHPDATVVGPAGGSSGFWDRLFELGGLDHLDEVSPHLYGFPAPPEQSGMTAVAALDRIIKQYSGGQAKPISVTESGFPTHTVGGVTELQQGDQLVRAIGLGLATGMTKYYYYDFLNDGSDPSQQEQNFGLMRRTGHLGLTPLSPKPALVTQAVMIRQLAGRTFSSDEGLAAPAHSYLFEGSGAPVRLLWATEPTSVTLATDKAVTLTDAYGRSSRLAPVGGNVHLDLTEHPVYLTGETGPATIAASPVYSIEVPEAVAAGEDVPVTLVVDRSQGADAPAWVTFSFGGERHRVRSIAGSRVTSSISVSAGTAQGVQTISGYAGRGTKRSIWMSSDTQIVPAVGLSVAPRVLSAGPLEAALSVTLTNNKVTAPLEIASLDWTVGDQSGSLADIPAIAAASSAEVEIPLTGIEPWASYPVTVSVAAGGSSDSDGSSDSASVSTTTGFNPIEADGDDRAGPIDLVTDGKIDYRTQTYGGDADLSGGVKLTHTADALVLTAAITDNVFRNVQQGNAGWNGDSIQLAVTPDLPGRSTRRAELLVALLESGETLLAVSPAAGQTAGAIPGSTVSVTREGTVTNYAASIPWAAIGFAGRPSGAFGLSLVVADDDRGTGRAGWIEWGGGIATTKNPALLRPVQVVG